MNWKFSKHMEKRKYLNTWKKENNFETKANFLNSNYRNCHAGFHCCKGSNKKKNAKSG